MLLLTLGCTSVLLAQTLAQQATDAGPDQNVWQKVTLKQPERRRVMIRGCCVLMR